MIFLIKLIKVIRINEKIIKMKEDKNNWLVIDKKCLK